MLHTVGDVDDDDDDDDGGGGGGCADDDSVICVFCFVLFFCLFCFVSVCFLTRIHGGKLLLLLEYFWSFSPLFSLLG